MQKSLSVDRFNPLKITSEMFQKQMIDTEQKKILKYLIISKDRDVDRAFEKYDRSKNLIQLESEVATILKRYDNPNPKASKKEIKCPSMKWKH